jgi:hypothetical protein
VPSGRAKYAACNSVEEWLTMLIRVTDYQERGPTNVQPRPVILNTDYIVAMEPWGAKCKVFVGRSLEYVVSTEDAERLAEAGAASSP